MLELSQYNLTQESPLKKTEWTEETRCHFHPGVIISIFRLNDPITYTPNGNEDIAQLIFHLLGNKREFGTITNLENAEIPFAMIHSHLKQRFPLLYNYALALSRHGSSVDDIYNSIAKIIDYNERIKSILSLRLYLIDKIQKKFGDSISIQPIYQQPISAPVKKSIAQYNNYFRMFPQPQKFPSVSTPSAPSVLKAKL